MKIRVGDKFTIQGQKGFPPLEAERLPNDPNPAFNCETMRVRVVYPAALKYNPFTFPVEPVWFYQRGLDCDIDYEVE